MRRSLTRAALLGSGAILVVIGSFIMSEPIIFLATSEVIVERDAGLASELTAPTGILIITGALMMLASLKLRFANLGLTCGAILYGSYGIGRLIRALLHGTPSETLIVVTYFELGVAALLIALRLTDTQSKQGRITKADTARATL